MLKMNWVGKVSYVIILVNVIRLTTETTKNCFELQENITQCWFLYNSNCHAGLNEAYLCSSKLILDSGQNCLSGVLQESLQRQIDFLQQTSQALCQSELHIYLDVYNCWDAIKNIGLLAMDVIEDFVTKDGCDYFKTEMEFIAEKELNCTEWIVSYAKQTFDYSPCIDIKPTCDENHRKSNYFVNNLLAWSLLKYFVFR